MKRGIIFAWAAAAALIGVIAAEDAKQPEPAPSKPAAIAPEMMEEFMKMAMETSRKIEGIKEAINAREEELFQTHPKLKELYAALEEKQQKINAIIYGDPVFARLKIKHDIKETVAPDWPMAGMRPMRGGMPMGMPPGQMMPFRPPQGQMPGIPPPPGPLPAQGPAK